LPARQKRKPTYKREPALPASERGETLFTEQEAADYLGVPLRWMRTARARGYLPIVKFPQYNRYRKADLDAYVEAQSVPAREQR
jgi:excisionase family DNA binding protein